MRVCSEVEELSGVSLHRLINRFWEQVHWWRLHPKPGSRFWVTNLNTQPNPKPPTESCTRHKPHLTANTGKYMNKVITQSEELLPPPPKKGKLVHFECTLSGSV